MTDGKPGGIVCSVHRSDLDRIEKKVDDITKDIQALYRNGIAALQRRQDDCEHTVKQLIATMRSIEERMNAEEEILVSRGRQYYKLYYIILFLVGFVMAKGGPVLEKLAHSIIGMIK